ncbi:hypothetical protein PVK06_021073 [Gossypium arboreum]|uniref:Uncharacterized protein n=1 Tax=Gossypium arboreum TaxID=29729 RepID=A0ABR0PPH3_GOSAR|nr:hypothetical protein PVK06_021073 [Gossypium arboreum]
MLVRLEADTFQHVLDKVLTCVQSWSKLVLSYGGYLEQLDDFGGWRDKESWTTNVGLGTFMSVEGYDKVEL